MFIIDYHILLKAKTLKRMLSTNILKEQSIILEN